MINELLSREKSFSIFLLQFSSQWNKDTKIALGMLYGIINLLTKL